MPEPEAYLNGRFLPASQASIAVSDGGFLQGTTVAEQLRTFAGRLFRLDTHLERLFHSLAIVEVEPGVDANTLAGIAQELVARNHALLATGDDLGLSIFVTPGPYAAMVGPGRSTPTVGLHTFPLQFGWWARKFREGESLATTAVEQVSPRSWPPELKCRSRMHYYLADRAASLRYPGARALLLDDQGFITETTTTNVVLYSQRRGLELPPLEKVLPGISLAVLLELAEQLKISHAQRDLVPADVAAADEAFLTSTSVCMLPVTRFNGQQIGTGQPGAMFQKLLTAWNDLVGLNVVAQAEKFAER